MTEPPMPRPPNDKWNWIYPVFLVVVLIILFVLAPLSRG
jgi:hypothetical protein